MTALAANDRLPYDLRTMAIFRTQLLLLVHLTVSVTRLTFCGATRDSVLRSSASVRLSLVARALGPPVGSGARTTGHGAREPPGTRAEAQPAAYRHIAIDISRRRFRTSCHLEDEKDDPVADEIFSPPLPPQPTYITHTITRNYCGLKLTDSMSLNRTYLESWSAIGSLM